MTVTESLEALRWRFAATLRRLATTQEADELLVAYERALAVHTEGPTALDALEQLPNWEYGTLLQAALEMGDAVPGLDAGGTMRLRQYDLLGWLAAACEGALVAGDLETALAVSQLARDALLRTQVEAVVGTGPGGVS